jgi:hypothetical protein
VKESFWVFQMTMAQADKRREACVISSPSRPLLPFPPPRILADYPYRREISLTGLSLCLFPKDSARKRELTPALDLPSTFNGSYYKPSVVFAAAAASVTG